QREDDILRRLAALEKNSVGGSTEQKKNKIASEVAATSVTPEPKPVEQKKPEPIIEKPCAKAEPPIEPPPAPEYEPEPPPEYYGAPEPMPNEDTNKPIAQGRSPQRNAAPQSKVSSADEGEFWHLKATAEQGLELQGKIVRNLRKSDAPSSARVMRLFARGVTVKERDDYIGFVSPDDVFLQMGEPTVTSVLNSTLDELGIKKRSKIERTEDDLYQQDIAKARQLFSRDGVIIAE
ncbi:MAG: hypothetical protein K2L88_06250, partial [Clostridiales bacterium]|nr:hypothetical protein [Clostridiales bacterium]